MKQVKLADMKVSAGTGAERTEKEFAGFAQEIGRMWEEEKIATKAKYVGPDNKDALWTAFQQIYKGIITATNLLTPGM
jgi:hypothetical protein